MNLRRAGSLYVFVIGLVLVLAGCGASSTSRATGVSAKTSVTMARPSTARPSTASAASAASASETPPHSAAAPSTVNPSSVSSPAAVVEAYFAAIDAENYEEAWALGGENLGESYAQFAAGFAATASDTVEVLSTDGNTVNVDLTATQTDGVQQQFTGTYTVTGDAITGASITQLGAAASTSTCGAPYNPYGYNFCNVGSYITTPAAGTCKYFSCIENFGNGRGYMVECNDGTYSMSGGIEDACSDHGGVDHPVYSGS